MNLKKREPYNFHIKKIKHKAAEMAIDNIDLREFKKKIQRLSTAKGILLGGIVMGIIWLLSL